MHPKEGPAVLPAAPVDLFQGAPIDHGGQSNEEADKECVTFPSCRDCWDLLEGIQLVNEHSRAESGLE